MFNRISRAFHERIRDRGNQQIGRQARTLSTTFDPHGVWLHVRGIWLRTQETLVCADSWPNNILESEKDRRDQAITLD
jgi:hypothetical protein